MKFGKLDTVAIKSGKFAGKQGSVVGFSQMHLNHVPQPPNYSVAVAGTNITDTFAEENLELVIKYDEVKAEQELSAKRIEKAAEAERIADEKMEAALRKKIEKEFELREQIAKEFEARKNSS
jgi:ribosomal protein L24